MHSTLSVIAILSLHASRLLAHGGSHDQKPILAEGEHDWATVHMAEEHHIANMDPPSFFTLHDYDNNGAWTREEIRRTYGLDDESTKDVSEEKKAEMVNTVIRLFDKNEDGVVQKDEWLDGWMKDGRRLPDFGTGPGHHGDDETEYEIHHWEVYHDENTKEEDLIHPEDIEHFKKHEEREAAEERQALLDAMQIVEANIPSKFRRN